MESWKAEVSKNCSDKWFLPLIKLSSHRNHCLYFLQQCFNEQLHSFIVLYTYRRLFGIIMFQINCGLKDVEAVEACQCMVLRALRRLQTPNFDKSNFPVLFVHRTVLLLFCSCYGCKKVQHWNDYSHKTKQQKATDCTLHTTWNEMR